MKLAILSASVNACWQTINKALIKFAANERLV
jgi:hypothetical protein